MSKKGRKTKRRRGRRGQTRRGRIALLSVVTILRYMHIIVFYQAFHWSVDLICQSELQMNAWLCGEGS